MFDDFKCDCQKLLIIYKYTSPVFAFQRLSSIKMDYTNERLPSGNASILFQSRSEAENVVHAVDSVLLRGHRVQVRIVNKR